MISILFISHSHILSAIHKITIKNYYYCQLRYDEESNYNYQTGTSNGGKIGHFTQIVWKGTTKLGIAKASTTTKKNGFYATYVVAQYSPAGNVRGRYRANVQQPGWGK